MNNIKRCLLFLLLLFLMPIIIGQLPFPNNEHLSVQVPNEQQLVYASSNLVMPSKRVLLAFTHSHEAYRPIVEAKSGKKQVDSHNKINIFSLRKMLEEYFSFQGIEAESIDVDLAAENQAQGRSHSQAYKTARTFIADKIAMDQYDLVIDFHRDSARKKTTTLTEGGVSYAKVAFVVGLEHPMHTWNLSYAEQLSQLMNELVPGISRGVIKKEGERVDGIYNQDLSKEMLLIELGGIDNTEEEITRTSAVLTEAISKLLDSQ